MNAVPHERLALRSRRIVTPDGVVDGHVVVWADHIAAVAAGEPPAGLATEDLGGLALLPGLVDTHVHVNEPGRTEWEGFATASRAALAGGVTTIVDMPLNSIPATTHLEALRVKRQAAAGAGVRVELWGGVVPGNAAEIEPLAAAGVRGFKCFLVPSGVAEFGHVGERELRQAMPLIARRRLPLLVHAESPEEIDRATGAAAASDPRRYSTWLASRPPAAEVEAIRMLLRLADATGCRIHVVHLSAAEALPELRAARARGLAVTVETCPHYLACAAEDIADGATEFKCAPPIRARANQAALWRALLDGDIDLVASDHSPCPPALKGRERGDFMAAWGGIASLELGLSIVWTEARRRGVSIDRIACWMAQRPAELAGLDARIGRIAPGADADLVAFDPEATWTVDAARLRQRHPVTPYAGRTLDGRVVRVWRGGTERTLRS
jgi:allantoinase